MKAAPEDQEKLLDLQVLDRKIAGLKHSLASIPAAARLEQIKAEQDELRTGLALATSARNDLNRALKQAEGEVSKVQERAKTQRERLDSGQLSPKEMERIQAELAQLATRQGELEDSALDALDALERASKKVKLVEDRRAELNVEFDEAQAEAGSAAGELQQELTGQQTQRDELAATLPADLLQEYETCKRATGGIGVVAVSGNQSVGMDLEFSMAEISRLNIAAPDDVIVSEDHEVILVRK